ncbi:RNA-binding protein [Anaerobacillus sp. MEB173]|uniref:YlmH family RNA-binding protein n=1 Tax=Anaerobacillus sp. MEB173 TaxID=3383345 RepID=UPI003F93E481
MSIYQHFRSEERAFIDQVLEWKDWVIERYSSKLTDFLDPRQQDILSMIIGNDPAIRLSFWGGSTYSERKRALLYPEYLEPVESDYEIVCFKVNYPEKFVILEHRDILGSLMGIGLKREKFGDILIKASNIQFVVAKEIARYVEHNLQSIGRATVTIDEISVNDLHLAEEEWQERSTTVSSLRLDTVIADIYRLSRTKVAPLIENNRVKVNWKTIDQPSFQLRVGDYISVRGFGRSKLIANEGKTKKDKWRLIVGVRK